MQKRAHSTEQKHKLNDFLAMKFEETDPNSLDGVAHPIQTHDLIAYMKNRTEQKMSIIMN